MKQWIRLLLTLLIALIYACAPAPKKYTQLENRVIDVLDAQSVLVQVDQGTLTITQSQDSRIKVDGQVLFPEELEYAIDSTKEQIRIKVVTHHNRSSKVLLHLTIQVPEQMQVKVETEGAFVLVQDYQGDLEVSSTAGEITAERIHGSLTLRSNRGNIAVRESSGDMNVVGNYGALTVQNVSGETAVSTIMGNIVFAGLIEAGDIVRLETDHGAVSVNLSKDSALSVQVHSTSGDVDCRLLGITSTTRTCEGNIDPGGGSLSVRTVSGAVTVQSIP